MQKKKYGLYLAFYLPHVGQGLTTGFATTGRMGKSEIRAANNDPLDMLQLYEILCKL